MLTLAERRQLSLVELRAVVRAQIISTLIQACLVMGIPLHVAAALERRLVQVALRC